MPSLSDKSRRPAGRPDARARIADLWRRGQRGWPSAYPLVQFPNLPLLVAIFGSLFADLELFGAGGAWRAVSVAGLVVWALAEIALGANSFRRILGGAVLVWVVLGLAGVR